MDRDRGSLRNLVGSLRSKPACKCLKCECNRLLCELKLAVISTETKILLKKKNDELFTGASICGANGDVFLLVK